MSWERLVSLFSLSRTRDVCVPPSHTQPVAGVAGAHGAPTLGLGVLHHAALSAATSGWLELAYEMNHFHFSWSGTNPSQLQQICKVAGRPVFPCDPKDDDSHLREVLGSHRQLTGKRVVGPRLCFEGALW